VDRDEIIEWNEISRRASDLKALNIGTGAAVL
jgi:hypothetical protein